MLSEKLTFEGIPTTKEEAQGYIDTYDRVYAGVAPWRQTLLDQQRTKGSVFLLTGRKRGLPDVDWNDKRSVHKAETTLSNNVVQGSGQDLLKASIVRLDVDEINPDKEILKTNMTSSMDNVHKALVSDYAVKLEKVRRALRKSKTEWLMQVHDETLYESNACDALEMAHMIAEVMGWRHYFPPPKGFFEYNVPLLAEGGVGYSWKEAKSSEEVKSPFIIPA